VTLGGVGEVRDLRVDVQLERAFAGRDRLRDRDVVVGVRELAARRAEHVELPREAVELDLIVRPFATKERPEGAPALVIGGRREVVAARPFGVVRVAEPEVGEGRAARRELRREAAPFDLTELPLVGVVRGLSRRDGIEPVGDEAGGIRVRLGRELLGRAFVLARDEGHSPLHEREGEERDEGPAQYCVSIHA
jgi:hypothetical protein